MTARTKKELLILAVLVAVLAGLLYRNQTAAPAAGARAPSNSAASSSGATAEPAGGVPDIQLETLDAGESAFAPPRRNPFRFREPPPPVVRAPAPPPPPVYAAPPDPGPPPGPDPRERIRYVGYIVTASGTPFVSLQVGPRNETGVTFVGREGDIIEGKYRLLRITPQAVDVVELDGRQRRATIPRVPTRP